MVPPGGLDGMGGVNGGGGGGGLLPHEGLPGALGLVLRYGETSIHRFVWFGPSVPNGSFGFVHLVPFIRSPSRLFN